MQTYSVGVYESRWIRGPMDCCKTISRNRVIFLITIVIIQLHIYDIPVFSLQRHVDEHVPNFSCFRELLNSMLIVLVNTFVVSI